MQSVCAMSNHQTVLVGTLLRKARRGAAISQLELALRLGVSQRHISFVERGYSRPGHTLLAAWLMELGMPQGARNAIMLHAGYTPMHALNTISSQQMELHNHMLLRVVETHNPLPAFIFDAEWRMSALNEGGQRLCALLMPEYWGAVGDRRTGLDMIDAMIHPQGLFSNMDNASEIAFTLLRQLRMEEWANPALQVRVDAYEESVHRRFGKETDHDQVLHVHPVCALQLFFTTARGSLSFRTVQNIVDLPQNVNLRSSRIELWFPADEMTHQAVMSATSTLQPVA